MARLPRLIVPGQAHHLVHRTVAGTDAFPEPADLRLFIDALQRSTREHRVLIHAYALIPQEFQLLATPPSEEALGRAMQSLARFYVAGFNRRHARAGALWQGRFRVAPVGGSGPLLTCMRYVEQAALRAVVATAGSANSGLVASSAAHHAGECVDPLVAPVPSDSAYWRIGNTPFERDAAYRRLLDQPLASHEVLAVESTTLKGWAFGSGEFLASLNSVGARRAAAKPRGRPRKDSALSIDVAPI